MWLFLLLLLLVVLFPIRFVDLDWWFNAFFFFFLFSLTNSRLKTELQFLRKKGALKTGGHTSESQQQQQQQQVVTIAGDHGGGSSNNGRCCARCRTSLGRIINRGAICKSCRQRVCKACREYNVPKVTGGSSTGGTDWVCTVCYKTAWVHNTTTTTTPRLNETQYESELWNKFDFDVY